MSEDSRKSWQQWLDGVDTVATILYVLLAAVVAGAVLGFLFYVLKNWPEGYGLGPQGEGFYLALAFLLVIGWLLGQVGWLIRRRRRSAWTFEDGSEIQLPRFTTSKGGFSIQWGNAPDSSAPAAGTHTWNASIPISNDIRTFRLDQPSLDAARAARRAGASWDEVCRQVNPEWDGMNALDRALYQRALEAAVTTPST